MRRTALICLISLILFALGITLPVWSDTPSAQPEPSPVVSRPDPMREPRELIPYLPGQLEEQTSPAEPKLQVEREDFFRLTYQTFDGKDWEIRWLGGLHAGDGTQITNNNAMDIQPRYNHGAARIAFVSDRTGNYDIWTMNPDGSDARQLTFDGASDLYPDWSPDNGRIAFSSSRAGQSEIYVMNSDGSGLTRLTDNPAYDGYPVWSPDGTRIAFVSDRGQPGNVQIWVMAADGSNPVRLSTPFFSENPAWSPDGTQIAFDADGDRDGWQELWVMNADGSNQRMIHNPDGQRDAWARSWTPDGRYVSFTQISFVYYEGAWYWTSAGTYAMQLHGFQIQASSGQLDWYPDWDTVDPWPPTVHMQPLPAESPATFTVRWSGVDVGPAGLMGYRLQVKDGDGPWTSLIDWGTDTSREFTGQGGHTYSFRCRATDYAGNEVPWELAPQVSTTIESQPPVSAIHSLPPLSQGRILLRWNSHDPGGSGVESYDLQVRDGADGPWQTCWIYPTNTTVYDFPGTPGHTYYFRCRATDRAGNTESWPPGDGDTMTTLYTWEIHGTVQDVRGRPIPGAALQIAPAPILSEARTQTSGNYRNYFATTDAHTLGISVDGYGVAPTMTLDLNDDLTADHVLPPLDDIVVNGGLELGTLAEGWQAAGAISPTLTDTIRHTGEWSALLGQPPQPARPSNVSRSDGATRWGHDLAMGTDGSVHVAWSQRIAGDVSTRVYYASKTPDGQWSKPVLLSGDLQGCDYPRIEVVPDGGVHVVWSWWGGLHYACRAPGQSWSAPELIPSSSQNPTPNSHDLTCDQWGNLHLILYQEDRTTYIKSLYYLMRDPSGGWSPAITLDSSDSKESAHFSRLRIIQGSDGTLHSMWYKMRYDPVLGHVSTLFHTTKAPGGAWVTPTAAPSWDFEPTGMAIDSKGTLSVVGRDNTIGHNGLVLVTKAPNHPWSSPELIVPHSGEAPWIAYGPDNTLLMVWQTGRYGEASQIMMAHRSAGGQWSKPQLYAAGIWAAEPIVRVDAQRNPHVVWMDAIFEGVDYGLASDIFYRTPSVSQAEITGDSILSQSLIIPDDLHAPTLSFLYRLEGASADSGTWFDVGLKDETGTTTLLHRTTATHGWRHSWFDVSPWAGQTVTIAFTVHQTAGQTNTWAYLDEVTLGSWLTPAPEAVNPIRVPPQTPVQITITGSNLDCPSLEGKDCALLLFLNEIPLTDVTRIDARTFTANVPALPHGRYDLVVTDASGRSGALPGAFLVGEEIELPLICR